MNSYLLEAPPSAEAGLTVKDVWKVFRRRRRVAYTILGAIVLLAAIYCVVATRRYMATGIVQLQKDDSTGLSTADLEGGAAAAAGGGEDALSSNINLETQSQILQSDTLALRVIKDLNLEQTRDFQPHFNPINWVMGLITPKGIPDPPGASLDNAPGRRTRALKVFAKNLDVSVVSGTRLIEIDYTSSDPKIAAEVVNHLIQGLTDYTFQTKVASTSEAAGWLTGQLADLRKQSEDEQEKLAALQKQTGIFSFGPDATGHEQVYSDVLDRLQQSTAALSAADSNRILKEAVYKAVQSGNAELISELSGTSSSNGNGPALNNTMNLIQGLRLQQATLESQIATAEQHYGSANPHMTELRASLEKINQSINDEVTRVSERAKTDFDVAVQTEEKTRQEYEANRAAADQLKDKAIDYSILREEADQSRGLYEDLLRKLKEAGVLQGLKASDITIVDPGRVPSKPKKPNVPLYMALSIVLGSLLGFGGAMVAESADTRLQTVEQLERLGAPLVGILPRYAKDRNELDSMRQLRTLDAPRSAYSEAVRGLRASLAPAKSNAESPRVIMVTSASPEEGKSLTVKNLAVSVAQQGKRVLLLDADMRRPADQKGLEFSGKDGLSVLLSGEQESAVITQVEGMPTLFILSAGPVPPNPSELLSSARMKKLMSELRNQFDVIFIDTPPVLPVVDAVILSEFADSTLLVARQGVTPEASLKRAYQILSSRTSPSTIGIVLNGVEMNSDAYHSYFGSKTSHYYMENVNEIA
jgi:succinoglycan biosynthesis transport protein ExoP